MKKLLVLSTMFFSFASYGQIKQVNLPVFYGTKNKIGIDLLVTNKSNLVYGAGLTINITSGGIGEDYSKVMGPNAHRNEIYKIVVSDNASIYGTIGYSIRKIIVGGKVGFGGSSKYYNAYDKSQILSPNGYYYTATDGGSKSLLGGFIIYKIKRTSPYIGYDTFNGGIIGISFNY